MPAETAAGLAERAAAHRRNLIPARAAALDRAARIDLFVAMAEEVQTTVARVASGDAVPAEVARYLAAENLPAELAMAPDPGLDTIPWNERPLLAIRRGRAAPGDAVSLTPCLVAIAETGTLLLASGPDTPTTLNFLPDTHIVVLRAGQVVASYEDGFDLVRARAGGGPGTWPRTVNMITGPSRTGDIEQKHPTGRTRAAPAAHHADRRARGCPRMGRVCRLTIAGLWQRAMRGVAPLRVRPSAGAAVRGPPCPASSASTLSRVRERERVGAQAGGTLAVRSSRRPAPPLPLDRFAGVDRATAERVKNAGRTKDRWPASTSTG